MKEPLFTDERNVQILLALLKAHGIRYVVANPGTNNIPFVSGVQRDPFFITHSAVDERHAAYLACGMSVAANEPVVLSCTGATASRNYLPAMTEAFYRKIPLLVITSSHPAYETGHLVAQVTDRTAPPPDTCVFSIQIPPVGTPKDIQVCETALNEAILALKRRGGGPVHINLVSNFANSFETETLPEVRCIDRIDCETSTWPVISDGKKIAVLIGSHKRFSDAQQNALDRFLKSYDAVALVESGSEYSGKKSVFGSLICSQGGFQRPEYERLKPDLIVHIGEISADSPTIRFLSGTAPVWRVSPDGEVRDRLGRLECVFEMAEERFFSHYTSSKKDPSSGNYAILWSSADTALRSTIPELPFSNLWIAKTLSDAIPEGSVLHLGILNSLRSWNVFPAKPGVEVTANVGGFGIDGCVSSLMGSAIVRPDILHFGMVGDLAFFYDMNALGNRHRGKNLRILIVNNGTGGEFNRYESQGSKFGEGVNRFIAAGGHFGNKSTDLVRHYAQDLGFEYLSATDKTEFAKALPPFVSKKDNRSVIFECFTDVRDDAKAAHAVLVLNPPPTTPKSMRNRISSILPKRMKVAIKELVKQ